MLDLYNRQYDMTTLKEHIFAHNLFDILKTQRLTSDFCVKYILNTNYQLTKEEESITIQDVIIMQPHISKYELYTGIINYNSDYDSFDDFETVSKREPEDKREIVSEPNTYYSNV